MTIAVVWEEDGFLWCAADTRLVAGAQDKPTTEIGSKIYSISMAVAAFGPDGFVRAPHIRSQFGFVYAGAALPASTTAVTATTLLQKLARPGNQVSPPRFEDVAGLVHRLARRFMLERRGLGSDAGFSAAFFGWCPHDQRFKVAHIDHREERGNLYVDLLFPPAPAEDGEPWLVLGTGTGTFYRGLDAWREADEVITKRVPRRVIERMVAGGVDPTVGGATSIAFASQHAFELCYSLEPVQGQSPLARGVFNGLDMETEIGAVGEYLVAITGMA